jgi:hypothetical protein
MAPHTLPNSFRVRPWQRRPRERARCPSNRIAQFPFLGGAVQGTPQDRPIPIRGGSTLSDLLIIGRRRTEDRCSRTATHRRFGRRSVQPCLARMLESRSRDTEASDSGRCAAIAARSFWAVFDPSASRSEGYASTASPTVCGRACPGLQSRRFVWPPSRKRHRLACRPVRS